VWPIFDVANSFLRVTSQPIASANDLGDAVVPQFHDPPPHLTPRRVGGPREEDAKQQHKRQKPRLGADGRISQPSVRSKA